MENSENLDEEQYNEIIETLRIRFEENMKRHKNIKWIEVNKRLSEKKTNVSVLYKMEKTGGEPDVIEIDNKTNQVIFYDCVAESPKYRRSLCYDREALNKRTENKPQNSVLDMASEIGIEILTEKQYRELQETGEFDIKTSSWIKTPEDIRKLGGALFCDRRYNHVFVYHNGAESYYSSRGFRGLIRI
ncbi:MAG: hypothetical protein A2015_08965 [Spirochaetes bacterium GWF1_31_7]|nr:MAG: hypothetical protein A2Y30_06695 [Spirochaetes bacterium GWE1_32_154]OHD48051.1 MAG: hypothetical protein A2015_08965 [Spirochaetes bacterium GWF1_31_7]OHD49632.1 MAG: hypothetical protein A2Y29_06670 [Spirochaetes bacterium GWE2_31_10]OHD81726.1 MAG: hypothetical protein A2355_07465 [Spirochaetes bacterium RIFOXYB1_FULL_32_8]HBD96184.1 DUF4256 domain-containing protein [Spirochaetia bacterium]